MCVNINKIVLRIFSPVRDNNNTDVIIYIYTFTAVKIMGSRTEDDFK